MSSTLLVLLVCFFALIASWDLQKKYCVSYNWVDNEGTPYVFNVSLIKGISGKHFYDGNYVDTLTGKYAMVWCFWDGTKQQDEVFMSCASDGADMWISSTLMFRINKKGIKTFEEIWFSEVDPTKPGYSNYNFTTCPYTDITYPSPA